MSLIVESGVGLPTAEAYVSVADATTYHAARGNAAWAALASDTIREQLLRKATDYMVEVYRGRWSGFRLSTTQALDWPRYEVPMRDVAAGYAYYPSNAVPAAVANACAVLALKASSATSGLTPDLGQAIKRVKAGSVEVEYQDYSTATKTYRQIDNMLEPLLSGGGQVRIVRA